MSDLDILEELFHGDMRFRHDDRGRWAQVEEARLLYDIAKETGAKQVFEIGTANGWTACWFALAGAEVFTFDISNRSKIYKDKHFPLPDLVVHIHGSTIGSPECVEIMKDIIRVGPTVWFIDGDHTGVGVTRDFEAVKPLLRAGDKVVFHDTKPGVIGVYRLWKRMNRDYPGQCVGHSTTNGIGVLTWQS